MEDIVELNPIQGGSRNLTDRLSAAGCQSGQLTIVSDSGLDTFPWSEIHEQATRWALCLSARDIGPGSIVMVSGMTSLDMIIAIRATWLIGAAIAVAPSAIGSRRQELMQERFRLIRQAVEPSLILSTEEEIRFLSLATDPHVIDFATWRLACSKSTTDSEWHPSAQIDDDALAIIQLTSGTTGGPKPVQVPRRCLDANLRAIGHGTEATPNDVAMSWLPLSHDMGLVGLLAFPMVEGFDLVIADPAHFVRNPSRWMEWCSRFSATITSSPSSVYAMAAHLLKGSPVGSYDLSALRVLANGSEPVDVIGFERFIQVACNHGLDAASAFPVYGLAEATLAVTFPKVGVGLMTDVIDDHVDPPPTSGELRRLALLGSPVEGVSLRISDEGVADHDGDIGEIHIQGDSVTPGYLGDESFKLLPGGWFPTGDDGYLRNGQLVVCGRRKDLIILGGRNIYAEGVENAVSRIPGVFRERVAAFGIPVNGRDRIIVIAESEATEAAELRRLIASVVLNYFDASVGEVRLAQPKSLPRTTSGKVSRSMCRRLYEAGKL